MKELALRLVFVLGVVGSALVAQNNLVWLQSPVNGHYYARLPITDSYQTSAAQAASLGVRLATIRNAAENDWLVSNICQGQECWIDLDCNRNWQSGWPFDWWPGGGCPNCSGCGNHYALVPGSSYLSNQSCLATGWYANSWIRRCDADDKFAILELITNDPYTWASLPAAATPTARNDHLLVFDSVRGKTVLFGGRDDFTDRNDTWEYTSAAGWTPKFLAVSPTARRCAARAFDPVRGVTVMFGGVAGVGASATWLADTWTWNGTAWTQVATPIAPSAREGAVMAFDFVRQRLVLFGGYASATGRPTDTWEWDGATWTQTVTPASPSGRNHHAMFYDGISQRTVVFGGDTNAGVSDQTWTYNGSTWTLATPSVRPPARGYAAYAWDTARSRGVLVGGWNGGNMDDVWQYQQGTWYKLHVPTRPTGRHRTAMVYEADRFHLFGGVTSLSITDPWIGRFVSKVSAYGAGCGSPAVAVAPAANALPHLGTTFRMQISNVPSTAIVTMMSMGFNRTTYNTFYLPLPLDGLGMPGCNLYNDLSYRFGEFCTPTTPSQWHYDLPLPPQLGLMGLHIYCQPWVFDPAANPGAVLTANALDVTLGSP